MAKILTKKVSLCRFCKSRKLKEIINLGSQPAANAFLKKSELNKEENYFPLKVNYCSKCGQLQLSHVVPPDYLFRNYVYVSSTSPVFVAHFEEYAKSVYKKFKLNNDSFVVDIGSNDGILLKPFKKLGTRILGVDPAKKIAQEATKNGIETLPEYFDQRLAAEIVKKYGHTDVISANNVFAHVPEIDELILAVKKLLKKEGIFIIEAPYLIDFLQKNLFDTIYHEHVSYLSIKPLTILFKRFNMKVFDVQKVGSHGGSIRVFVRNADSKKRVSKRVKEFIDNEEKLGLRKLHTFIKFRNKIEKNKLLLNKMLKQLKKNDKKIIGYGAPAKGNTLLNYFKIGPKILDYIVDDSEYKQGLFTPGTHIPVVSPDRLKSDSNDYILILAWNFAKPITEKYSWFRKGSGKFIIPVPIPKII